MVAIANTLRRKGITKFNTTKLLYRFTHLQKCIEGQETVYLVYTLGKVGSQTIYITLREKILESDVFHLHFVSDSWFNNPNKILSKKPEAIKIAQKVRSIVSSNKKIKIISLVRDPIAKTISQIFQTPEAFGFTEIELLNMKPKDICHVLTHQAKSHFHHPSQWFEQEFLDFTGLDIYRTPFEYSCRKQTDKFNMFEFLILRNEDLQFEEQIINSLQKFIGKPIDNLIVGNKTNDKITGDIYKKVKNQISFNNDFLNEIYSSKYCQHFYSKIEIEEFKKRWTFRNK